MRPSIPKGAEGEITRVADVLSTTLDQGKGRDMGRILESDLEGTVKFYRFDDGWGFIERDSGGDVFVYKSSLVCSAPYEGERVRFDIAECSSPEHEHEAVNVSRVEAKIRTGDVLEWRWNRGLEIRRSDSARRRWQSSPLFGQRY